MLHAIMMLQEQARAPWGVIEVVVMIVIFNSVMNLRMWAPTKSVVKSNLAMSFSRSLFRKVAVLFGLGGVEQVIAVSFVGCLAE